MLKVESNITKDDELKVFIDNEESNVAEAIGVIDAVMVSLNIEGQSDEEIMRLVEAMRNSRKEMGEVIGK